MVDPERLVDRLSVFPRAGLAHLPTPLQEMTNLTRTLKGPRLLVKRDDNMGLGVGGNKVRKLDFLMGEALRQGVQRVVTFGRLQSNHLRQTASAARKLGLEPVLVIFDAEPSMCRGNVLLGRLMDAEMHFFPRLAGSTGQRSIETQIRLMNLLARGWPPLAGRRNTCVIPVGGHTPIGALGYVEAAAELCRQAQEQGLRIDVIVTAAGTGGTMAGLMAGLALLGAETRVVGIDIGRLWDRFATSIARLATQATKLLGRSDLRFEARDVRLIDSYVGTHYGVPTRAGNAAVRLVARQEGLILDPVYTGKAMAGLVNLIRQGAFGRDETVVFLHTGGLPALFAFSDEFQPA